MMTIKSTMHDYEIMEDIAIITTRVQLDALRDQRILVTGGSGLLGRYIVNVLMGVSGVRLHVHTQHEHNFGFDEPRYFTTSHGNLSNPGVVERLPEADTVICAHSYAQPLRFLAEPLTALRGASYGLLGLLEKCVIGGRFMYLSSSEVYCDCPEPPPHPEEHMGCITPYHPRACYIMAKMYGEAMVYLYRQRGISTVSVRPGITYGPGFRRDDQRSWCSFIQRAVDTKEIRLLDAGLVSRTFCYIADGIAMLFNILVNGRQEVYNLAGEDTITIHETAQIIAERAGAKVIVPAEDHGVAGTPDNLAMEMERYKAEFGAHEYRSLEDGFARSVAWYRRNYGA